MTDKGNKIDIHIFFCDNTKIVMWIDRKSVEGLVKNIAEVGYARMNSSYEEYQISINWNLVKYFVIGRDNVQKLG